MNPTSIAKKLFTISAVVGMSYCNVYAQNDSLLSPKTIAKKINRAFGVIATGQSEAANLVNYGSFEPLNGAFKVNLFGPIGKIEKNNIPFYSASATGNLIGDKSAAIFGDSKLNNGNTLSGKIHIPIIKTIPHYSKNHHQELEERLKLAESKFKQKRYFDSLELLDINFLNLKIASLNKAKKQKREYILKRNLELESLKTRINIDTINVVDSIISITKQIQQIPFDTMDLDRKINEISVLIARNFDLKNNFNKFSRQDSLAYQKIFDSVESLFIIEGKSYYWLSPTATIGRKKYYTFNDLAAYNSQLQKRILTTFTFGVEFNFLSFSERKYALGTGKKLHTHVVNVGIVYSGNNNIEDLTTTELSDSRKYTASDSTHTLVQKYNVYTDPVVEYKSLNIYANYFYYFGKTNNFALHFAPGIELRNTKQSPINVSAGIIFAYKNKKENNIANIELFSKFIDVNDALKLEQRSWLNRNIIGINFGFPLNIFSPK